MKKSKKLMILGLSAATAAVAATGAVSSFAWFAINDQVTAEGMVIKADAGQYLEISRVNAASEYTPSWGKTAVTTSAKNKEIKPVALGTLSDAVTGKANEYSSYTASTTWSGHKWAYTSSDSVDSAAKGTNENYLDVTDAADVVTYGDESAVTNAYALVMEFDIRVRYLGDETTAYKLSANVDWANTNSTSDSYSSGSTTSYLHNAARVYFVVGAQNETSGTTAAAIDTNSTGKALATSTASGTSGDWDIKTGTTGRELVSSMTAKKGTNTGGDGLGNGVRVRVYFYFDGTDANCFSSAVLGSEYSINLTFSVEKANA